MIAFIVLAILTLAGLFFRQTSLRFKASTALPAADGRKPAFKLGAYFRWLWAKTGAVVSPSFFRRTWKVWNGWAEAHYPGWVKWVFLAFAAAFVYQAASGLFFAVFIRRGLFGLPLLIHVMSGGLFALGLAAVLIARARAYRFDQGESVAFPVFKNLSVEFARKVLFWVIAVLGLVQVATALASMLPVFTFNTQVALLMIHRWSALGLTLAAVLFFDLTLLERPKTPGA
ncbi:MAG: hypothetical protein ACYDH3_09445 [Candidatus Aminicenantales bacterium]